MRVAPPKQPNNFKAGILVVLVVVSILIMTVWYREGSTGILHGTRNVVQTTTAPIVAAGEWVTSPIRSFGNWVSDLGVSRSKLLQIRNQNDELRARIARLEEANLQYKRLDALIGEASDLKYSGVAATVIGLPLNSWEQVITVDKGTKDGIRTDMPVMGPSGLLGQVVSVGAKYARVRLITDQRSGVASLIQRGRYPGVTKGSFTGSLTLNFVSVEATVTAGDVVLTSGLGGIYPKGLTIGEVIEVSSETNALYKKIRLLPANNLSTIEQVLILTNTSPAVPTTGGE